MSEWPKEKLCPFHAEQTHCTKKIRLFQALPDPVQDELMHSARHRTLPKGYVFASEGDPVSEIIIIRKGSIRTYRLDEAGNEYVLDILHDAQAIWHDMFLKDACYHYSIEAASEVEVCEISREIFIEVLRQHPEASLSLIQMLSAELSFAKEKILLLSIRSPVVRTAGFLLYQNNESTDHIIHFRLEDIAATIRLRSETISRIIRSFEKQGIIERTGQGKLVIQDQKQLYEIYHKSSQT